MRVWKVFAVSTALTLAASVAHAQINLPPIDIDWFCVNVSPVPGIAVCTKGSVICKPPMVCTAMPVLNNDGEWEFRCNCLRPIIEE